MNINDNWGNHGIFLRKLSSKRTLHDIRIHERFWGNSPAVHGIDRHPGFWVEKSPLLTYHLELQSDQELLGGLEMFGCHDFFIFPFILGFDYHPN